MTIIGNEHEFSKYAREREAMTPALMMSIVNEVTDKFRDLVISLTPPEDTHWLGELVDYHGPKGLSHGKSLGTEKLIESIFSTQAAPTIMGNYSATVESHHHAVLPVEYGSIAHFQPERGNWHPGHTGAHMFQRAAAIVEATIIPAVGDEHIRLYLE